MSEIIVGMLVGCVAGGLDIIPMVKSPMRSQPMYRYSIKSVFFQWVLLGTVLSGLNWRLPGWITGSIVGFVGMVPIMILTFGRTRNYFIAGRILVHGAILGALIAMVETYVLGVLA